MGVKNIKRPGSAGERHWNHRLTWVDVDEIRDRYHGGEMQVSLAKEFKVSQPTISLIVSGVTWPEWARPTAEAVEEEVSV